MSGDEQILVGETPCTPAGILEVMNLPKIIFRRSWLYDNALARDEGWKEAPPEERMQQSFLRIQNEWREWEEKLLTSISDVIKLPWNEKEIVVYFTWGVYPYSDPVTINAISDIHVLTHELIHRILSEPENQEKINSNWEALMNSFPNETPKCKTHIVVHAIHHEVMKKYFNDEVINKEMEAVKLEDYVRSWEIIRKEGADKIVQKLTASS